MKRGDVQAVPLSRSGPAEQLLSHLRSWPAYVLSMISSHVIPASVFLFLCLIRLQELAAFLARRPVANDRLAIAGFYAACVHRAAAIAFLILVIIFFIIRTDPVHPSRSLAQAIVAVTGTFMMALAALAPQTVTPPLFTVVAAIIMLGGAIVTAGALLFLGRSFSITPEARQLVTRGMYTFVRHPMYLGEILSSFGLILQSLSLFSLAVFVTFCLMQMKRMDYEESVLQGAFPEYSSYKQKTARLIPGVY